MVGMAAKWKKSDRPYDSEFLDRDDEHCSARVKPKSAFVDDATSGRSGSDRLVGAFCTAAAKYVRGALQRRSRVEGSRSVLVDADRAKTQPAAVESSRVLLPLHVGAREARVRCLRSRRRGSGDRRDRWCPSLKSLKLGHHPETDAAARAIAERRWPDSLFALTTLQTLFPGTGLADDVVAMAVCQKTADDSPDHRVVGYIMGAVHSTYCVPFTPSVWPDVVDKLPRA